ncbi:uncharacterized protein [Apostichopus japonicus]|uniref:uncharacterized protein n=1 Tax=Stichopus japonicus TaxID=307972 RepID=UPI003AB226B7
MRFSPKQRVVSYVDVMDVREKMVPDQPQPNTTKKIPQCSLPRIPEAAIESLEVMQPKGTQDSLSELKEVQLVTTNIPPFAIVKKSSKLTNTSENVRPSSLLSMGRVSRSNSSAYAIVDDLNGTVVGSSSPISTRNSSVVPLRDQQPPTEFASLYAKVNKNKNSNNEHKHRFSHGNIPMSFVEDDSIYGKLDHPPQSQLGVTPAYNDSLKYDRLKRGPLSRSIRKSKRFSELYESI